LPAQAENADITRISLEEDNDARQFDQLYAAPAREEQYEIQL
jgi:hypothetical protein